MAVGYSSSDEERGKKLAQKKYEHFQQICGDLLDPGNYYFLSAFLFKLMCPFSCGAQI